MNAREVVAYACGSCGASPFSTREVADSCCQCSTCGEHIGPRTFCRPCAYKREADRDAAAFAKATKIPLDEYAHAHVFYDCHGDEGYIDVDSLDDEWPDGDRPAYVWGCSDQPAPTFDLADEIANRLGDDYHESVVEAVVSGGGEIKLAQRHIDIALQRGRGFAEDRSIAVLLPPSAPEEP